MLIQFSSILFRISRSQVFIGHLATVRLKFEAWLQEISSFLLKFSQKEEKVQGSSIWGDQGSLTHLHPGLWDTRWSYSQG